MTPGILTLQQLTIGYEKPLLENISFTFDKPALVGLIGNNGKGKTTLLKTIAGLQKPLGGEVMVNDKNISSLSFNERARLVSFGLSSSYVTFPMPVRELVSMGRYPYTNQWAGLSKDDEQIVSEAVSSMKIEHLQNSFVTGISDGEKQKAFIAKTLAQQTPVILFDEPTAFLDYSSKKYFFSEMKKLSTTGNRIIIISSHDVEFLSAYADDLLMIEDDGRVSCDSTDKIIHADYFQTHFTSK
jgi:iron complex transport system ATP-binding protein